MWMLRDDGGVVYLNGNEAYRSPTCASAGDDHYLTVATKPIHRERARGHTIDTAVLSASLLSAGTNFAAVEIHQHDTGSSDASFDLELTGNLLPSPAVLSPIRFANDLVLAWNDASYTLEEADFVTGPWRTAAPATSPSDR